MACNDQRAAAAGRSGRRWTYPPWPLSLAAALLVLGLLALGIFRRPAPPVEPAPPEARLHFVPPTPQQDLLNIHSTEVYMPTASGRIESAWYGSTRTRMAGGRAAPSFHMGIDIAPTQRDRRGRALDPVLAAAAGRVAYINASAGRSNYGKYIVLAHDDPVGVIYTLYAHLAECEPGLRAGQPVRAGDRIGRMGHSPAHIIPLARSHLHFEIGVRMSLNFSAWTRAREMPPYHGEYHGWNLTGIQPLAPYRAQAAGQTFSMLDYLRNLPPAFMLRVWLEHPLDFFQMYPGLWEGAFHPGAAVLAICEAGIPLRGRNATESEERAYGAGQDPVVLRTDEAVLGRNGRGLIRAAAPDRWELTENGRRWLSILTGDAS